SSTYTDVFAMGVPSGIGPAALSTLCTVDQMVVSVGPYMFHSEPERSRRDRASAGGNASPPHNALNVGPPDQPASIRSRHVDGVACMTVASLARSKSRRRAPSDATSRP